MKGWLAAAVAVSWVCGCAGSPAARSGSSAHAGCRDALSPVTIHGARGVVLPSAAAKRGLSLRRKDVESYWYPSEDDVAEIEIGLRDALKERLARASKDPPSLRRDEDIAALRHIIQHLDGLLRQYVGIVVNGGRRVLVNALPEDTYCWRDEYIQVEDGGPWFWTIQYDVKLHQFLHWELTGKGKGER